MSNLVNAEKAIYDFFIEIMKEKKYNVYRGTIPRKKLKDREQSNDVENSNIYPCLVFRVLKTTQRRDNNNGYDCNLTFEAIIGTKNEEYLDNMLTGEYVKEKIMDKLYSDTGFMINQSDNFSIEYYNDEYDPFIFSKITFSVYGSPIVPNINLIERAFNNG